MQRFTYLRYCKGEMLLAIHLDIHVSIAQLSNWNRKVLQMVSDYAISFTLGPQDIFYRSKVINLVEIFTIMIEFFEKVDPEYKFVSRYWLNTIRNRRMRYRKVLSAIDDCVRNKDLGMQQYIVSQKILHPHETDASIALTAHVDKGAVSRHLKKYTESILQYLN